jgi:hypothetical protein
LRAGGRSNSLLMVALGDNENDDIKILELLFEHGHVDQI